MSTALLPNSNLHFTSDGSTKLFQLVPKAAGVVIKFEGQSSCDQIQIENLKAPTKSDGAANTAYVDSQISSNLNGIAWKSPVRAATTAELADDACTEAKIVDGAVTTSKISAAAAGETQIAGASITTNKIGTPTSLTVSGNANATAFVANSDRTLKKNISDLEANQCLGQVCQWSAKKYEFIAEPGVERQCNV
jgi:hypothetical protein